MASGQLQAKLDATQQQLQQCEATVLNLTAQLQKAVTYAGDKLQAHTSLQQRLAGAELDWDKERKQSSAQLDAVQDQLKQLQGHYNQATADLEDKQAAFAELQLKYEGSEKRVHKLMAQLQDAEAAAPGNQAQQVELRLSQQQEAEPEVKTGAPAQEAAERTSSQLETQSAPGTKKKKKKGKKQAQEGPQDKLAGQFTPPNNAAVAHKIVDSAASPDTSQTLLNLQSQLTKLQEQTQVPSLYWDSSWVIQREVGRGGSGIVSRCTSPAYPDVVVKKGVLFRLREEARMMHMLNHPNVARAYAVLSTSETTYDDDVTGYLAMRRLGPSLANLLTAPNASRGMVDQDVQECNVLETLDGKAWVKADLGNAALLQQDGCPTKVLDCRCAASREAPEIADSLLKHGWYEPQCSSDMWALGLLMVIMVQGTIPEAQRRLQTTEAYMKGQREGRLRLATSQAQRDHLQYLAGLLQGDSGAYAAQVTLPSLGHPKALPMKQAILGCLQVQPQKRLTAKEVQVALHEMMQDHAWI